MPPESSKLLVLVLRKIPIFKGLSPSQVKKILGLCMHKSYKMGSQVCRSNSPSDEMYILLSGALTVVTSEGIRVATILPVTTVGEMGVITGQPRSATVEVSKPSNIFVVRKDSFDAMLRDDGDVRAMVYKNIIDVLSGKLNNDNIRMRDYQLEKDRYESRLAVLERQLLRERLHCEVAVEMAAERGDMSIDEVTMQIDEQVGNLIPKILVVVDEADFCRSVKEALDGFTVVAAGDGREALAILAEEKLDLVITEILTPNIDGFALLENLRAQYPQLPVLAVSDNIDAEEVWTQDFDGYIDKPVRLAQLQELVEEKVVPRNKRGQ
ncbi:MAG TPA: response regulator [Candidatus Latescibacteria bacterium]|nr:response regulator [Candidatus Handelsmanbacteria bacterium]HIL08889.1 response regulator [Candidatus Latescibacterota bacterium]